MKKKLLNRNNLAGVLLGVFSLVSLAVAQSSPKAEVASPKAEMEQTLEQLVTAVEKFPGVKNTGPRRNELRTIINPKFDFAEMAKRSLGAHWNTIKPEEQQEFVTVFSNLLAKTYLSRIETVERGMVKVDGDNIQGEKAVVKTTVTSDGEEFPIDYRLMRNNGKWQVYDVIIENIGLVTNYRNEFAGIIRKDQFPGLLQRLKEKTAKG